MNYKNYPTVKSAPQRMTRKRMRREVFESNRKMAKLARKAKRLERKSPALEE